MKSFVHAIRTQIRLSSLVILIFLGNLSLSAQITITENIITDNFDKNYRFVLYETNLDIDQQLATILAATGPNQTWDFSNLNYVDSTVWFEEIMNIAADDPYMNDPNFANSNFIRKGIFLPVTGGSPDTTVRFQYSTLENGNWIDNASVSMVDFDNDGTLDTLVQWFSPPRLSVSFPVSSTSQWHDSTSLVQVLQGMEFTSAIELDSNWVEGSGMLITPAGSFPALRIREKLVNRIPNFPTEDVSIDLDFVTADDNNGASIVTEDGRAFYSTRTLQNGATPIVNLPHFRFRLEQNHPNPFSDKTRISFDLDNAEEVIIQVLDIKGKSLALLADKKYPAGNHELIWSGADLAAGIYLLELRVGNQIQHRKMAVRR